MTTRAAEAVGMALYCAFFAWLALVTRRTTSQWHYVSLFAVAVGVAALVALARGYTFSGPGLVVQSPASQTRH